jgi:molybdate transport repressor ModE-like protein
MGTVVDRQQADAGLTDPISLPVDADRGGRPSLDSSELRVIHALARNGSLTAAAAELGLSQPAVSQRIKRVETRLGVPIIERSGRGIRLTQAGQILAHHAKKVVAEIDRALEKVEDLRGGRGGILRLVGFPSASATIVPEMMQALPTASAGVTLEYREAEPPEALQLLAAGEVDAAIVFDYAGTTVVPAGTQMRSLWEEELRLVVPKATQKPGDPCAANLADFATQHWIAGCEKCRGNLLTAAAEHGFHPDIVQETDNIPAMVAMVAAGGGVGMVPGLALASMRGMPEGTIALPLDPPRKRTIGVVNMSTATLSPQVVLLRKLLAAVDVTKWNLSPLSDHEPPSGS